MKKNLFYFLMLFVALGFMVSCDDDDDPNVIDNPTYGMQVIGTATGNEPVVIDARQMVEPSSDFATKVLRDGMYYQIAYLGVGDIMFKEVTADSTVTYGATNVGDSTQTAETGEAITYKTGTLVLNGTETLAIAEAGMYYIMTDKTTSLFWIMKIDNFEISATGDKATYVSGSATGATFVASAVDIRGLFKVRMNTAWKLITTNVPYTGTGGAEGDHCRPVISYGGTIGTMTPDGADITVDNGGKLLDFTFTWTPGSKGIAGVVCTTVEGAELPPLEFPANMYMVGASLGGWDWAANGIEMIPANGQPHLFWRIVWIESGVVDAGFKFSPDMTWPKAFGITGAAVDGVYAVGGDNVPDVATSGYYMVVVNLEDETIEVNAPKVYGIGDAFGSWDAANAANIFTVDNTNEVITSPAFAASANLRMHVAASTLTDAAGVAIEWWRAEFNVIGGNIEYRGTGGDQAAVPVTAAQTVSLNFKLGTGTIQ